MAVIEKPFVERLYDIGMSHARTLAREATFERQARLTLRAENIARELAAAVAERDGITPLPWNELTSGQREHARLKGERAITMNHIDDVNEAIEDTVVEMELWEQGIYTGSKPSVPDITREAIGRLLANLAAPRGRR
jgi:hypothetical protein